MNATLEVLAQERHLELREGDTHVARVLTVVVVDEAAEVSRQTLVRRFELDVQDFGAFEYVTVLVIGTDAEAKVALTVGALEREGDCLRLVAVEQNVGIDKQLSVYFAHCPHVDVDILDDAKSGKGFVGAVDVACVVDRSRSDEAILVKNLLVDVSVLAVEHGDAVVGVAVAVNFVLHSHGVVVCDEDDITNIELAVRVDVRHVRQVLRLVAEAEGEIHVVRASSRVGKEGDIALVEGVVAIVAQPLHYQLTLGVKLLVVEWRRALDGEVGGVGQNERPQTVVRDVVGDRTDAVRLVQGDIIIDLRFFLLGIGFHLAGDGAFEISLVDERALQLFLARRGESGVVDYRWSANSSNPFVEPVGRVLARHVVDGELHFEAAQHFVVLGLPEIIGEFLFVDVFLILLVEDMDFHLVEQELSIGHVFGRGAREEHRHQK